MTWCNVSYIINTEHFPNISSLINFNKDIKQSLRGRAQLFYVCVYIPISLFVDDSNGGFTVRRRCIVRCKHLVLSVFLNRWDTYSWWNFTVVLWESRVSKVKK